MTRTNNIVRNSKYGIVKLVAQIVLQFVLRTVLLKTLGENYIGLNGFVSNILSFLNLAELGIGGAIVFSMYKPIADNDTEKIKTLNNLYKKAYIIIACIVLVLGLGMMPFLKYLIKDGVPIGINIYLVYFIFLINTVAGYFVAHKRSLLNAYQRVDIESKIKTVCLIVLNLLQIVLLLAFKNYYIYICLMPVFTILESIFVIKSANKLYPDINGPAPKLDKLTQKTITKNIMAMSIHSVAGVIVFATDNILITAMIGLSVTGIYSNYALIISTITSIISIISDSTTGSIGNLIASSSKEHSYKKFKELNFGFAWMVGFCAICLICLLQPFMSIWTLYATGREVMLPTIVVLVLVISFYISGLRRVSLNFKHCAGLIWNDRWKAIAEAVVNLVVSIVLAKYMGLIGIFIGTIVSTLVAPFWVEPYVLYKNYFKKSVWSYFGKYAVYTLVTIVAGAITYLLCWLLPSAGIWWFVLKCFICLIVPNLIFLLCYFKTSEFKYLFGLLKEFIANMKIKNKNARILKYYNKRQKQLSNRLRHD